MKTKIGPLGIDTPFSGPIPTNLRQWLHFMGILGFTEGSKTWNGKIVRHLLVFCY